MTKRRLSKPLPEGFEFLVEDWAFGYGLYLHPESRHDKCWDHMSFTLFGRLVTKTHRKIERIELRVYGDSREPRQWTPEWKAIGAVYSVQKATLTAGVHIPSAPFDKLFAAVAARKVGAADISIVEFKRNFGRIMHVSFDEKPSDNTDGGGRA
jgi:hypothetical protein